MMLCLLPAQAWAGTLLANSVTGWTSLVKIAGKPDKILCAEDERGETIACGEARYFWGEKWVVTWSRRATGQIPKVGSYVRLGDDDEAVLIETPNLTLGEIEWEAQGFLFGISTPYSVRIRH